MQAHLRLAGPLEVSDTAPEPFDQTNDLDLRPAALPKARRRGLNRLQKLRRVLVTLRLAWLRHGLGMDIDTSAELSLRARPDRTFPQGVHIGARTYVAFDACILTHDRTRGLYLHTRIGENCFLGARSMILPGVTIGANAIVAAGAVVTRDVAPFSIVAGNPARLLRHCDDIGPYGRLGSADAVEANLARRGLT